MIANSWRERLLYGLMSVFVAWHTAAMLIAPAPDESGLVKSVHGLFQSYLTLFRLDNQWDFFAPNVSGNSGFRYVVKDSTGVGHTFTPMSKWNWFHPSSIWFHDLYDTVLDEPDVYGDSFARILCKEHADLKPVSIVLQEVKEREFWPEDLLSGKSPMDPEFVDITPVKNVKCPDQ